MMNSITYEYDIYQEAVTKKIICQKKQDNSIDHLVTPNKSHVAKWVQVVTGVTVWRKLSTRLLPSGPIGISDLLDD